MSSKGAGGGAAGAVAVLLRERFLHFTNSTPPELAVAQKLKRQMKLCRAAACF